MADDGQGVPDREGRVGLDGDNGSHFTTLQKMGFTPTLRFFNFRYLPDEEQSEMGSSWGARNRADEEYTRVWERRGRSFKTRVYWAEALVLPTCFRRFLSGSEGGGRVAKKIQPAFAT